MLNENLYQGSNAVGNISVSPQGMDKRLTIRWKLRYTGFVLISKRTDFTLCSALPAAQASRLCAKTRPASC